MAETEPIVEEKEVEPKPQRKFNFTRKTLGIFGLMAFLILVLGYYFVSNETSKRNSTVYAPTPTATPTVTQVIETPTLTPKPSQIQQSFLEIPEYGVKFALSDSIKDAYYLPATADKGYVYLKVHSLDSEPQCAEDNSSTAALSRVGKDDINEMSGQKYSDSGNGVVIGNYYYYIDLAQYECAESIDGKATLVKVRKAFTGASTTIEKL